MKKRKRASGGGRKPGGELRNLTAVMSLRMPQGLRDQLEQARQASGRSLSQELLWRAGLSFDHDRDLARDRALRAFCFLFSELAQTICVDFELLMPDWRFDPWLFRAFKLAIANLLDRFQPVGLVRRPAYWESFRKADIEGYPLTKEERARITETPDTLADFAVQKVLSDFSSPEQAGRFYKSSRALVEKLPDTPNRRLLTNMAKQWGATYYGMTDAQRDLAPRGKTRGRK